VSAARRGENMESELCRCRRELLELLGQMYATDPATVFDSTRCIEAVSVFEKAVRAEALAEYAWWKDGVQYVGACGTTLKQALQQEVRP
jgi:hypothetical protein